jgi:hypothetical protein
MAVTTTMGQNFVRINASAADTEEILFTTLGLGRIKLIALDIERGGGTAQFRRGSADELFWSRTATDRREFPGGQNVDDLVVRVAGFTGNVYVEFV